jgi:thiol-disulfide isomerase/thioredoxin
MKNKLFQFAGAIYVSFSIFAAHSALVTPEEAFAHRIDHQAEVVTPVGTLLDSQRLDDADADSYFNVTAPTAPKVDRSSYTVVVWSSSWCGACKEYKKTEVPALRKLGYRVVIKDYQTDKPPKEVKSLPTIELDYKGKAVKFEINWKAKDIDKFVAGRLILKK